MKRIFLSLILLNLISCSKPEGLGGRSSISGKLEGTISSNSRAEITEITCVAGANIKHGDYLFLNTTASNSNYYIWFYNTSSPGASPSLTGRLPIQINYNPSSSNISIASSIETAINAIVGNPFTVIRNNDVLTITNNVVGEVVDADNGTSKMGVNVSTQGRDQIILQSGLIANEDVYIIYGTQDNMYDDRTKTNYDGTFQFANLRKGSYRIFAYSQDASLSQPLTPIFKSVNIGKKGDTNIGTITIEKKK